VRKLAILFPLLFLLTACASLGLAPASSFEERLAYAVSQNAAVRNAAAASLERQEIALEDAQRVLKITDEVRTALDAARFAVDAGDPQTAEGRLQLATAILVQIQTYLRSRA
jgi:hypothetical protein